MLSRCYRELDTSYLMYGAKGITVSDEWHDFDTFVNDMVSRPEKHQLDRINGNLGYSKENCRWVTQQQNLYNKRKYPRNKSGYKGVSETVGAKGKTGKWRAAIAKDNIDYVLGRKFDTAEEAARAYDTKAKELFGEFACLNFK